MITEITKRLPHRIDFIFYLRGTRRTFIKVVLFNHIIYLSGNPNLALTLKFEEQVGISLPRKLSSVAYRPWGTKGKKLYNFLMPWLVI